MNSSSPQADRPSVGSDASPPIFPLRRSVASANPDRLRLEGLGVAGYVVKPSNPRKFFAVEPRATNPCRQSGPARLIASNTRPSCNAQLDFSTASALSSTESENFCNATGSASKIKPQAALLAGCLVRCAGIAEAPYASLSLKPSRWAKFRSAQRRPPTCSTEH
jgi:hypothetical protein